MFLQCFLWLSLFFMIFFFRIDAPDVVLRLDAVYDILDGLKGSDHGMIDIVVAVLSVTSDAVQIVDGFQVIN